MLKKQEIEEPDSCLNRAEEDEPVFVFRAKDPLATIVVNYWIWHCEKLDIHKDRMVEAKEWVNKAILWQSDRQEKLSSQDTFVRINTGEAATNASKEERTL